MINNILREYLDTFVIAYLDDILIFSETLKEYKEYICLLYTSDAADERINV